MVYYIGTSVRPSLDIPRFSGTELDTSSPIERTSAERRERIKKESQLPKTTETVSQVAKKISQTKDKA